MQDTTTTAFSSALFDADGVTCYGVFDGARVPGLADSLRDAGARYQCLFAGDLAPELASVSPYLVELEPECETVDWWLREGWGKHWGVALQASATHPFTAVRRQLRKFSRVRGPDGDYQLFRFYDPRVLSTFMPSVGEDFRDLLFGDVISAWLVEGQGPRPLRYRAGRTGVVTETLGYAG